MMLKRFVPLLVMFLAAGAYAQSGPGGGRGHGGRGQPSGGTSSPAPATAPPPKRAKPTNQIEIVGVVMAIDPDARRITIAYEAVDELGWPHGTMPFSVYKADLLNTVTVGERVRFKLDSQQITELGPFDRGPPGSRGAPSDAGPFTPSASGPAAPPGTPPSPPR